MCLKVMVRTRILSFTVGHGPFTYSFVIIWNYYLESLITMFSYGITSKDFVIRILLNSFLTGWTLPFNIDFYIKYDIDSLF